MDSQIKAGVVMQRDRPEGSDKATIDNSIAEEMTRVVGLTGAILESLGSLEGRISTVLGSADDEPSGPSPLRPDVSPLLLELRQHTDRLLHIQQTLSQIERRVQL